MLFKRKKRKDRPEADGGPRPPIIGTIQLAGRIWNVREERRAGPRTQLLVLAAEDDARAEMHVRPDPGQEAKAVDDVEPLARSPLYRWFDHDGSRWEVRIVVGDALPGRRIKFISWTAGVFEGDYAFDTGLGLRTDEELRGLLAALQDGSGGAAA